MFSNPNSEIKNLLWTEPSELFQQYQKRGEASFDGVYAGLVVDNNDPKKEGRCRIKVFGIFEDLNDADLPWATPDFNFIGSDVSSFIVPPTGTTVAIYFDRGDFYFPHYITKITNGKFPKNKDSNYPNNMVFFETDGGTSFEIDRTDDNTAFLHKSGTQTNIDADGNIDVNIVGDHTVGVDKGVDVAVNENITVDVKGNINISTDMQMAIDAQVKASIESQMILIKAEIMKMKHTMLHNNGKSVIPTGVGPFCALPTCPVLGIPHSGQVVV